MKRIAGWLLLSASFSAGMVLGCVTPEESYVNDEDEDDGSGGGTGICNVKLPKYGKTDLHDCIRYNAAPVYPTECPPNTIIITGTIEDKPYTLVAPSQVRMIEDYDGFLEITFPGGVSSDDFIFLDTTEAFGRNALVPSRGILKLPNTTKRYPILRESRVVVGGKFERFDFHIILSWGDLQGCVDGWDNQFRSSPQAKPSPEGPGHANDARAAMPAL